VLYASYLSMARAGLVSLEMWNPKSQKWGQAHSQARFSILQVSRPLPKATCRVVCTFANNRDSASSKPATTSANSHTRTRICLT